jgi:penicillin-binding protein 2
VDGDDLEVRRAAVDALGPYNGTVVVVDPQTGRVLTMVNQKTALDSGFTPALPSSWSPLSPPSMNA